MTILCSEIITTSIFSDFDNFLIEMSKYGIWDIISVLVLLISLLIAIRYLWFPVRNIDNLHFYISHEREDSQNYPSKILIEIRNFSNKNLVLSNVYFKPKKLVADKKARGDSSLKRYELKFNPNYESPDCLIIHGKTVLTFFPIDSKQSDDEINDLLTLGKAGRIICKCTFLTQRPRTITLKKNVST